MRIATAHLKSIAPYSQSKPMLTKRDQRNETAEEHENRCWPERMHVNSDGNVFIPPTSFKNSLSEAAKYKSLQIPGKGKSTYTKHFEAGVQVVEPLVLDTKAKSVEPENLFVPSDGRRGGTKRVWKLFPFIPSWEGPVQYLIFDDIISPEIFEQHLEDSGQFIGIGRFRPRNNGYYGRFEVKSIKWEQL